MPESTAAADVAVAVAVAERRQHPRHVLRHPLPIELEIGDAAVPCELVDVSAGGMRVRSTMRLPVGPCDAVLGEDRDDRLVLRGQILEETIDVSSGTVIARIALAQAQPVEAERLVELADGPARRRTRAVLLGAMLLAVIAVVGFFAATRGGDGVRADAVTSPTTVVEVTTSAPGIATVPGSPTPTTASAPSTVTTLTTTVPPAPATTAPPEPPPATITAEPADNAVHVVLGSSADDTSVQSTSGPSVGVDEVRVQLNVTPEPQGTALPVEVTIENRSDHVMTFPDGLKANVTATRDGAVAATGTLSDTAVTQVAPGETVRVSALFDLGATGEYDLTVSVDIAE